MDLDYCSCRAAAGALELVFGEVGHSNEPTVLTDMDSIGIALVKEPFLHTRRARSGHGWVS